MYGLLARKIAFIRLMAPEGDASGGGGGKGAEGKGADGNKGAAAPDALKELEAVKATNAALEARLAKLEGKAGGSGDDPSLSDKARAQREAEEKKSGDSKTLEKAMRFNLGSAECLKTNATLLPKTVAGIFEMADKEKYESEIEKASAIKVGIVSEFFSQQANLDLLTQSQKTALEDFQKLTKNLKHDRAQQIYDLVFEPTFESLKRIKKAEQLQKGIPENSDAETAYKEKMKAISKKAYLRR